VLALLGAPATADVAGGKRAFVEGERLFALGRFDEAIAAYEKAYSLDPRPGFLFNIAQAHRRQFDIDHQREHLARARELYRNYLAAEPAPQRRAAAEQLLAELTTKLAEPPPVEKPPEAPLVEKPPEPPAPTVERTEPRLEERPKLEPAAPVARPVDLTAPAPAAPSHRARWAAIGVTAGVLVVGAIVTAVILAATSHPSYDGPVIDLR
jgi:tetratricopeptide (TPR) repeat protein